MNINIAFVCIGNSCRSQIAEGYAKNIVEKSTSSSQNKIFICSAGTYPAYSINPVAVEIMKEKNIDISDQYPKSVDEIPKDIDILITMGCGVQCPYLPARYRQDWGIEDPIGMPVEFFRKVRDTIEKKVQNLISLIMESDSIEEAVKKLGLKN